MNRTLFSLAALLSLTPAALQAANAEPISFRHDHRSYRYTVNERNGVTVLRGTVDGITPFMLFVGRKSVHGYVNNHPISFKLKDVKPLRGKMEVAER